MRCRFLNKKRMEEAILKNIENRRKKKAKREIQDLTDDLTRSKLQKKEDE